jgi:hypothetical protein
MRRSERAALAAEAQRQDDHQRWADDGGLTPDPEDAGPAGPRSAPVVTRYPWVAVGTAAALGFALGWLAGRRYVPPAGRASASFPGLSAVHVAVGDCVAPP